MQKNEAFYLQQEEPNRGCLLALGKLILEQDSRISETTKYGMPCFCFKGKMFCYLWIDKKTDQPYVLFVEGKNMDHPKLETGGRARMKVFRIDANQDLPMNTLFVLLNMALDLYRNESLK